MSFNATVAAVAPAIGTPSGSVTFAGVSCDGGNTITLSGGLAQCVISGGLASQTTPILVTGAYSGDPQFLTRTGNVKQTVSKAGGSSTSHLRNFFIGKSTTTLTLSQYGGFVTVSGDAATITATVVAPNGAAGSVLIGPMSGNITFTITDSLGTPVTCVGGNSVPLAIDLGQVEGTATCFLAPGSVTTASPSGSTYTIQANYGGDSNYVVSNAQVKLAVVPPIA